MRRRQPTERCIPSLALLMALLGSLACTVFLPQVPGEVISTSQVATPHEPSFESPSPSAGSSEPQEAPAPEVEGTEAYPDENAGRGATATVGSWELALVDLGEIPDYGGEVPAEGHVFYRISLNVLNRAGAPMPFPARSIGRLEARWGEYAYPPKAIEHLGGYVPPGWPLEVKVIFDLPLVVDDPLFLMTPLMDGQGDQAPIILNTLGSSLHYELPRVLQVGDEFRVEDKISFTPTGLRIAPDDSSGSYHLLLTGSMQNLYGYDIQIEREPLIFQLFSVGLVEATHADMRAQSMPHAAYYSSPGRSLDYAFQWISDDGESNPLAPGLARAGAVALNEWWPAPPPNDVLVLIMYGQSGFPSAGQPGWALYQLGESASALLQSPISSVDTGELAFLEAMQDAEAGKWVPAALLLGYASELHPGDDQIVSELMAAQGHAGKLVFQRHARMQNGRGQEILLRELGSGDSSAEVAFQSSTEHDVLISDQASILSPDGSRIAYPIASEGGLGFATWNSPGWEVGTELNVELDMSHYWEVSQYAMAWSASGERVLIALDGPGAYSTAIARVDLLTGAAYVYSLCEGTGWITSLAWSPVGTWAAFVDRTNSHVGVMDLERSDCSRLVESPTDWVGWGPILWSADGDTLLVVNDGELIAVSIESEVRGRWPLLPGLEADKLVRSPDGRYLAIQSSEAQYSDDVYVLDMETGHLYQDKPSDMTLVAWIAAP